MAASGSPNDDETETSIDVSGFMRAFTHDDGEEDSEDGNHGKSGSGDISMFCKACLHPYCGEQKAGTIVLRCERCGQTDTVLEERIDSLNPQEWIGNLMMNRFMQVVKEQEDLSANLTDPLFTNDEYQRVSLAISEYTFNIERIAAQMFDIAKKTRVITDEDKARIDACNNAYTTATGLEEVQAMKATKTLIEFHKALILNEPKPETSENASENTTEESSGGSSNQMGQTKDNNVEKEETNSKVDKSQEIVAVQADDEDVDKYKSEEASLLELTRDRLSHLGPTIMTLIETLISKYNLPDDVMTNVEERLRNASEADDGEDTETQPDGDTEDKEDCTDDKNDHVESEQELANTENNENDTADDNEGYDSGEEGSRKIFNVPTETIRNEVYAALEHKLRLSFDPTECDVRSYNLENDQPEALCPDLSDLPTTERENPEKDVKTVDKLETTSEELNSHDKHAQSNEDGGNDEIKEESFLVNFYSLSSEFIRELQRRKSKALGERKDKALTNIHEKISRLKEEMMGVEEAVTEELSLAYKRKMKKVEKQKKQLDQKRDQVKEAERLLEFYAMTGQQDKVNEMIEQLNIQFEN